MGSQCNDNWLSHFVLLSTNKLHDQLGDYTDLACCGQVITQYLVITIQVHVISMSDVDRYGRTGLYLEGSIFYPQQSKRLSLNGLDSSPPAYVALGEKETEKLFCSDEMTSILCLVP
jgi:hypothetical protein